MNQYRDKITHQNLDEFLQSAPRELIIRELVLRGNFSEQQAGDFIDVYFNEAFVSLDLINNQIDKNMKILEVGAGICIFSIFLKKSGFNIVALEPSINGFSKFSIAKDVLLEIYSDINLEILDAPAHELKLMDRKFDFIFSNNVLEHIPNLKDSWLGMVDALSLKDGKMIHHCPNYFFPFEPHLSIPVIKYFPEISKYIFSSKVKANLELWNSLNFISYRDVKDLAKNSNLAIVFKRELLAKAFVRIDSDPLFRARHSSKFFLIAYKLIKKTHFYTLLKYIPPSFSTPMTFLCSRK